MTSVLNVDTIADKAGTGPVALTKQSAAKAFAQYDGNSNVIDKGFNMSSITDNATGNHTLSYTSSFDGVNYAIGCSGSIGDNFDSDQNLVVAPDRAVFPTASSVRLSAAYIISGSYTVYDGQHISAIMMGDLA